MFDVVMLLRPSQRMRSTVGAVNVRTGFFVYFDTTTHAIGPKHIMASAALPSGFPAIEIEGEHYWDGGSVSNTQLQWVVNSTPHFGTLAFQVDLCNARGELPRTIAEVTTRQKEIQTRVVPAQAPIASNTSSSCAGPLCQPVRETSRDATQRSRGAAAPAAW
jgi:predicted acylesterase/phospholipase RssA